MLNSAQLLYLCDPCRRRSTGPGWGDGRPHTGKSADFVYLKPVAGSPLAMVAAHAHSAEDLLSALFTLAGQETVAEVRVRGRLLYSR